MRELLEIAVHYLHTSLRGLKRIFVRESLSCFGCGRIQEADSLVLDGALAA